MVRYGVFEVGQIWRVVSSDGTELGFPSREGAVAAARVLQHAHRIYHEPCEFLTVDEASRLVELAIPDAVALSHSGEVFEGFARRLGIPVAEMLAEHGRKATLLGRLPRLAEVAEFAAFAASDRAGAMTGAIANLTCGSMVD